MKVEHFSPELVLCIHFTDIYTFLHYIHFPTPLFPQMIDNTKGQVALPLKWEIPGLVPTIRDHTPQPP